MKQQEMFTIVKAWRKSNLSKQQFVKEQSIRPHKLNYWIGRYNKLLQHKEPVPKSNFQEINLSEDSHNRKQKILELTTQTGTHIIIYE